MPLYMILPIAVTGIILDQHSISLSEVGQTEQLTYTILPVGAEEDNVTWSTSNPSIATVSSTGLVTCVTPGECVITVTTVEGGFTDTCNVSSWILWDETDFANSTTGSGGVIASTYGKFIRPSYSFGGGNGNYTKGTENGFDVLSCTTSHGNLHIGMSDANYNDLMSHTKIMIVFDYFNLGANQSSYTNGIYFGGDEYLNDTASSSVIGVGNARSGMTFNYSTGYSMVQIIDVATMSCTAVITNLTTQQTRTYTYTKVFQRETNSTYIINGGGNRFFQMADDQGGGLVSMGNLHVYYA